jgi:hypothetical protein
MGATRSLWSASISLSARGGILGAESLIGIDSWVQSSGPHKERDHLGHEQQAERDEKQATKKPVPADSGGLLLLRIGLGWISHQFDYLVGSTRIFT